MKKNEILLMIDPKDFSILRRFTKKEYLQEFDSKQRENINGLIRDYRKNKEHTKLRRIYKGYFYCLEPDYNIERIKKYILKRTYYNFFPNFKPNEILLYFEGVLINKFKSERKCSEYLGIRYQNLNYHLKKKGYYEINGFRIAKKTEGEL